MSHFGLRDEKTESLTSCGATNQSSAPSKCEPVSSWAPDGLTVSRGMTEFCQTSLKWAEAHRGARVHCPRRPVITRSCTQSNRNGSTAPPPPHRSSVRQRTRIIAPHQGGVPACHGTIANERKSVRHGRGGFANRIKRDVGRICGIP